MEQHVLNPDVTETDIPQTIFEDKYSSLLGRQATQDEIMSLNEEDKKEIENRYQYVQDYQKQESIDDAYTEEVKNDPNNVLYTGGKLTTSISNTFDIGYGRSKEGSYKRAKQIMHDYAKLSSAEQAVIDMNERDKYIQKDPELITPEEARSLAGGYGVELKYDKNVSRGEVMFAINKNLIKKDLEQKLADYSSGQSFSAMQQLGMMGSAISGGVGFYETAATVGLSFVVPHVAVGVAAKVGSMGKLGLDISRGVQLAYKAQRARKLADRSFNTVKMLKDTVATVDEAAGATKAVDLFAKATKTAGRSKKMSDDVAKVLKASSEVTQMSNKLANVALRAPGAEAALTLGQQTALTAADGLVSSIPAMMLSGYNSVRNQSDTYTAKDCAIDALLATALGGIIPIAGKGLGMARKVGVDAFGNIKTHIKKNMKRAKEREVLEGVSSADITKNGEEAIKGIDSAQANFKQPDSNYVKNVSFFGNLNMTETEFMDNFKYVIQKLCNGEVPNLANLPHRSMLISHLGSDLVDNLRRGVQEWTPELLSHIQQSKVGNMFAISVKGETGLIGRAGIKTFSAARSPELLSDIYKAVLDNDMDSYIKVANYVEQQHSLIDTLLDVAQRADELYAHNQAHAGTDKSIKFVNQEQFKETLKDVIGRLKYGDDYDEIKKAMKHNKEQLVLNNKAPLDLDQVEKELLDEVNKLGEEVTLRGGEKPFNVNSNSVANLAAELEDAAKGITDLLDTDELLKQKYGSAENMIDAINKGTVYGDTDLTQLFGLPRTNIDDFNTRVKDVETQKELSFIEKQRWDANQADEKFQEIDYIYGERDKKIQSKNKGDSKGDSFYTQSKKLVAAIDQFLNEGIVTMREGLQAVLTADEFKTFINSALVKGAEGTRATLLKKNTSVIRSLVATHIDEPLAGLGIKLSEADIVELADRFIDTLETGKIKSILQEETGDLIDKTAANADEAIEKATQKMQKDALIGELIDPLMAEVQKLALNKQFRHLHSLNIITEYSKKLMENPYIPGEVITSIFTYSPYNLFDAGRNVEYIVRNSQASIRDIEAELRRKSSGTTPTEKMLEGGVDLVEYMHNPANRKGILTALTYMDWYGSADAAKKAGVPFNADDAVVAQVIRDRYATMLNNLTSVGSLRQKIGNRYDLKKLRQGDRFIPDTEIQDVHESFDALVNITTDDKNIQKGVNKIVNVYKRLQSYSKDRAKVALFALKHFDLDKMFNAKGTSHLNFNDVRDALFSGELAKLADTDVEQFNKMADTLNRITDFIVGRPSKFTKSGDNEFMKGWLNSYLYKTEKFDNIKNNLSNKYVDNFNDVVTFKSVESELTAMDLIGYDRVADQLNHDFETGQRAYAILKKAGSEPIRLAEDLMDFHGQYRELHEHDLFPVGSTQHNSAQISKTTRRSVIANAAMAAGVDQVESRCTTRMFKAIADIFSSPLLVNAGFRSMTDYSYQQEWMIMNGLMESKDLAGWLKGVDATRIMLQDEEVRRLVFYNQFMMQDAILRMKTNVDTDSIGSLTGVKANMKEIWDALSSGKGTGLDRLERVSKAFSAMMINDIGMVDKFTQIHRSAAALTLMRSISAHSDIAYTNLHKNLQLLLERQGITELDWNFLRQNCNLELNDFLIKGGIENANLQHNFKLFIPDNLLNVSDDVFKRELALRKIDPENPRALANLKNELYEKASILINASADEMTTLPTYRTVNAMSLGHGPKGGWGEFLGAVTKFQSFGMACTQMHFGRRIAQYCDTTDAANVQVIHKALFGAAGGEATKHIYGGLLHLMFATSMAQFMLNEAMDTVKGQRQSFTDEKGRFNWADKVVDPVISSTGIFYPLLDGLVGTLARGQGGTGGFSVQAVPAVSTIRRAGIRIAKPWFDEEASVGEKAWRSGAAFTNVLADQFAVSNWALSSLAWRHAFGGWLEKQERGAKNYRRYIKGRKRQGYSVNQWNSRYQSDPKIFGTIDWQPSF